MSQLPADKGKLARSVDKGAGVDAVGDDAQFSFDDVMREPLLCGAFHKFLKQSFCDESLLCYKEIEYFQSQCLRLTRLERFQDCKAIYEKFIEQGAEYEVNINDGIRMACAQRIAEEEKYVFEHRGSLESVNADAAGCGGLFSDVFSDINNALRLLMANDSYMRFVTSPLYTEGSQLVRKLHSIGVHVAQADDNFTDEEWSILMTGAENVFLKKGTELVTQGQFNQFFFKLVSGALRVEKMQSNGEAIVLNVLKKKGTVLCEMSIVNRLPTSASIIADTDAVVQKMKASFITNFFLTTENGPQLGVRFYKRLGRTLCMILCQITTMEPKSVYSTQRKTIADIIAEHKSKAPTASPESSPRFQGTRKGTAGESDALKQKDMQAFKHRFPRIELREPLLAAFDCWFEKSLSRKGTFYISSDALYMYSSVFGQKSRDVVVMSQVRSVDRTGTILVIQAGKRYALRFEKVEARDKAVNLLDSLISALERNESPPEPEPEPKMKIKSAVKDDTARIELNMKEWDMLVARSNDSKCVFTYSKGDVILREGDPHKPHLFQICSGKCRVEKAVPNPKPGDPASVVLTTLGEGEVFGEIMFLTGSSPTASVIADEDNVELYVVDSSLLSDKLFQSHPAVVVRFYAHLCSTIGSRIVEREADGWSRFKPNNDNASPSGSTPGAIQRRKQQELFRLANPQESISVVRPGKSSAQTYWVEVCADKGAVRLCKSKGGKVSKVIDLLERCVLKTDNKEVSLLGDDGNHLLRFPTVAMTDQWLTALHQAAIDIQTKTLAHFKDRLASSVSNCKASYGAATKKGMMRVQNMQLSRKKITDEQWQTCFVVLALEHLYFFDSQDDARKMQNCKQQVNVLFGITKKFQSSSSAQRMIQIISDKASMLLASRTEEESDEWLAAIAASKKSLLETFIKDARTQRAALLA